MSMNKTRYALVKDGEVITKFYKVITPLKHYMNIYKKHHSDTVKLVTYELRPTAAITVEEYFNEKAKEEKKKALKSARYKGRKVLAAKRKDSKFKENV